jgi:hypothetical protein
MRRDIEIKRDKMKVEKHKENEKKMILCKCYLNSLL